MSSISTEVDHIAHIKTKITYKEFVILMAAIMACNSIAIDIMLPALPLMAHDFNIIDPNAQQYIVFSYLIGLGVGQLAFGPISDSYGRRRPLLLGLICYCATSLACLYAPNYAALLLVRFVQGIAGASTRVLTISAIRDLYQGRRMAEVLSIVIMVFLIVPVIAPTVGEGLLFLGNWQNIFLFMSISSCLIFVWAFIRLPETLYERRELSFRSVKESFQIVIANRPALCYSLSVATLMGVLFGMIGTTEQIFNNMYHLGALFPLAFAAAAGSQAVATFINAHIVGRFGVRRIAHMQIILFSLTAGIWWLSSLLMGGTVSLISCLILYIALMFFFGGMAPNLNSLAMDPLGKVAGAAASVFGFLQITLGAGLGALIGQQFTPESTVRLAGGYLMLGIFSIILVLIAEKGRLFNTATNITNEQ